MLAPCGTMHGALINHSKTGESRKPLKLWSNNKAFIEPLYAQLPRAGFRPLIDDVATTTIDRYGKAMVTGGSGLKKSQVFCSVVQSLSQHHSRKQVAKQANEQDELFSHCPCAQVIRYTTEQQAKKQHPISCIDACCRCTHDALESLLRILFCAIALMRSACCLCVT